MSAEGCAEHEKITQEAVLLQLGWVFGVLVNYYFRNKSGPLKTEKRKRMQHCTSTQYFLIQVDDVGYNLFLPEGWYEHWELYLLPNLIPRLKHGTKSVTNLYKIECLKGSWQVWFAGAVVADAKNCTINALTLFKILVKGNGAINKS